MLKLRFRDQRKPAIWLVDARYSIGRSCDCHLAGRWKTPCALSVA